MDLDLEKLILSQHVGALLFVALQFVLQFLNLHCQVVDNTAILVGATTLRREPRRSVKLVM